MLTFYKTFTEVTAPKSNVSANSTMPANADILSCRGAVVNGISGGDGVKHFWASCIKSTGENHKIV